MMKYKRKIIRVENFVDKHANGTRGTNVLYLDCGHDAFRKGSYKIPDFIFCKECERLSDGTTSGQRIGNIQESWDPKKELPIFTEVTNER
jgi:hypothetical protein